MKLKKNRNKILTSHRWHLRTKKWRVSTPAGFKLPRVKYHTSVVTVLLVSAFLGSLLVLITKPADAVTKSWDGGCGVDTTWTCQNNWSDNIVPVAGDTVNFNATSTNNSVVDASYVGTIAVINITAGYTGTLSLSRSLVVGTSMSQATGTFTAGGQNLDINGSLTITGGTFTASSTTTSVATTLSISGSPSFNHNGGNFIIDGITSATITCNNVTFNLVTITPGATATVKTIASSCNLPLGNNPSMGTTGNITLNGTLSGTGQLSHGTAGQSNTLTISSTGVLSGFTALVSSGVIFSGATFNASSYTQFDINGPFTLSSGAVFTAPSLMTVAVGFTINSGTTFTHNNGTVTFDGSSSAAIACNNQTFNAVNISHLVGTKTINSDCTLPLGNDPTVGADANADITLNGTLSGTGTLTQGTKATGNLFTINTSGLLSGFSNLLVGNLTIAGATTNLSTYTSVDVNFVFITSGTAAFSAPAGTLFVGSTFTLGASATFNHSGGTVTIDGTIASTLTCNGASFHLVTFAHTALTKTIGATCTIPLGNNPTIGSGASALISIAGTVTGTGIATVGTASTVNSFAMTAGGAFTGFSGLNTGVLSISGTTLNTSSYSVLDVNLSFTLAASATFTAPAGNMTVAGNFTINIGSTFNHNNGTLTFDGLSTGIIACNNTVFNLVAFNHLGGQKTVNSDCTLPLGANPQLTGVGNSNASLTLNGTLSGSGTMTSVSLNGSFKMQVGANLIGFTGLSVTVFNMTGATFDFSSYTTFDVNLGFALVSGSVFTAPTGNMTVAETFLISSSTFNANGGTLTFDGTLPALISCNSQTFNQVIFAHTSGVKTVNSDCALPLGSNPTIPADVTLSGTFSGSGTLTIGTNTVFTLNSSGVLSGFNGLIANSNLTFTGITFNASSYTTFDLNANFTLGTGTSFTAPSGTLTLAGDLMVDSGATFTHNSGTVVLDGGDQEVAGSVLTFNNFSKTISTAASLTFPVGLTQTILGTLTLSGEAGELLTLNSATALSQWRIDPQGSRLVEFVDVSDSNNTNATAITAVNSVETGTNNSNWQFVEAPDAATVLNVIDGASGEADLSWTVADDGGSAITNTVIEYRVTGTLSWTVENTNDASTTYTIAGLDPGTEYDFRVTLVNNVGSAPPSSIVTFTLQANAPDIASGLNVVDGAVSEADLSWTVDDDGGSAITNTIVEYREHGTLTWTAENTNSAAVSYTITGLLLGTDYDFRVTLVNTVGSASPSSIVRFTVQSTTPSAAIGLSAVDGDTGEADLSWTVDGDGGSAITNAIIEYRVHGTLTWSSVNTNSAATNYTVTGLTAGSNYDFRVTLQNSTGSASASSVTTFTLAAAPGSGSSGGSGGGSGSATTIKKNYTAVTTETPDVTPDTEVTPEPETEPSVSPNPNPPTYPVKTVTKPDSATKGFKKWLIIFGFGGLPILSLLILLLWRRRRRAAELPNVPVIIPSQYH